MSIFDQGSWNKLAFFELPQTGISWMNSHCQLPVAVPIGDNRVRVFFASRTEDQRSHVGFVEAEIHGDRVDFASLSTKPALEPGDPGRFDEHGVYPSSILRRDGEYLMYYIGWNRGYEAPMFYASIGLARSSDGIKYNKAFEAPIMARSEHDPCLVTSPHVYFDDGTWRMSYVSCTKWERHPETGRLMSFYNIKYAESMDGIDWRRNGEVAIDFVGDEKNIARSSVVKESDGCYKMWYSYVPSDLGRYRIGFAESHNGKAWIRKDERAGIFADDEYTSEMICYPCVFKMGGSYYMLYNGDNFGEKGFGLALWERS